MSEEMPRLRRVFAQLVRRNVVHESATELNLRQTVDGLTMVVGRVYADVVGIIIGYTLSGPRDEVDRFLQQKSALTDELGVEIQRREGPSGIVDQDGPSGWLEWFDGVDGNGRQEITLYLRHGAFAFDIPTPVSPGWMIEPAQVAVADGWAITLERVAVSPAGLRVTLRGAGVDADVQLVAGGVVYPLYQQGAVLTLEMKKCWAEHRHCPELWQDWKVDYDALAVVPAGDDGRGIQVDEDETTRWLSALTAAPGEWAIIVKADSSRPRPMFQLEGGPWTFHFVTP